MNLLDRRVSRRNILRIGLLGGASLAFYGCRAPATTAPPSTIVGIASNDPGSEVAAVEAALGRRFAAIRYNANVTKPLPDGSDLDWNARGLYVYRNANNETSASPPQPMFGGWAGVAAGEADAYLDAAIPVIRASFTPKRPFLFSFHHEQRVRSSSQCGIGCNGSAADYRAAFRHVADHFAESRVSGILKMCCVPGIGQFKRDDSTSGASVIDPGPDVVDLYGCDAYATAGGGGTLSLPSPLLDLVSAFAAARGKPYIVGEWGVATTPSGADYWREAAAQIISQPAEGPGSCYAILTDTASFRSASNVEAVIDTMVSHPRFTWG